MDRTADDVCKGSNLDLTGVKDETYCLEVLSLLGELRSHATCNIEHFGQLSGSANVDSSKTRLFDTCCLLREHIDRGVQPGVEYLTSIAHLYDVDSSTIANGYRSFVLVVERCCQRLLTIFRFHT